MECEGRGEREKITRLHALLHGGASREGVRETEIRESGASPVPAFFRLKFLRQPHRGCTASSISDFTHSGTWHRPQPPALHNLDFGHLQLSSLLGSIFPKAPWVEFAVEGTGTTIAAGSPYRFEVLCAGDAQVAPLRSRCHERRSILVRPSGARGLHFTSSRCMHSTRPSKHSATPWRPEMDAFVLLCHVRDGISLPKVAEQWPFESATKRSKE